MPIPRYFSGLYDSTKQAQVYFKLARLRKLASLELKDLYKARLRLDMLLCGKVVITDSMYFDGLFFQAVTSDEEFFSFLKKQDDDYPLFEVKIRDDGLLGILRKPYYFSSLKLPRESRTDDPEVDIPATINLRKEVEKNIREALNLHSIEFTHEDQAIVYFKNALDSTLKHPFTEMCEKMVELKGKTPINTFVPWRGDFGNCFNEARKESPIPNWFENYKDDPLVKININKLLAEFYKEKPIRTRLWEIGYKEDNPNTTKDDPIVQLMAHIIKVYNLALAKQHNCILLDVGENLVDTYTQLPDGQEPKNFFELRLEPENFSLFTEKYDENIQKIYSHNISEGLYRAIAQDGWIDFYQKIERDPIKRTVREWRNVLLNPESTKLELSKSLFSLVNALEKVYTPESSSLILTEQFKKLIGGGSLLDIFQVPGLILRSIPLAVGVINEQPWKDYNLIKMGLRIADEQRRKG